MNTLSIVIQGFFCCNFGTLNFTCPILMLLQILLASKCCWQSGCHWLWKNTSTLPDTSLPFTSRNDMSESEYDLARMLDEPKFFFIKMELSKKNSNPCLTITISFIVSIAAVRSTIAHLMSGQTQTIWTHFFWARRTPGVE